MKPKPLILSVIFFTLFIVNGCDNVAHNKQDQMTADTLKKVSTQVAVNTKDIADLNERLKKQGSTSQYFRVGIGKVSKLKGSSGTTMSIDPNDFETESGQPVRTEIDVELKELVTTEQLMEEDAQTVSDGKQLVSAGAYYINLKSGGEQLKLKAGKDLRVQFPKLSAHEMSLFYGQRDSIGRMNWKPAEQKFVNASADTALAAIETNEDKDIRTPPDKPRVMSLPKSGRISVDDFKRAMNGNEDSVSTNNMTAAQKKQFEIRKEQLRKFAAVSDKVYNEISVQKLGWINCDRFLNGYNVTNIVCNIDANDKLNLAKMYLVFRGMNSLLEEYYYADPDFPSGFHNVPVGAKATLVAFAMKNGKMFTFRSDLVIEKDQKISIAMKETPDNEVSKYFRF